VFSNILKGHLKSYFDFIVFTPDTIVATYNPWNELLVRFRENRYKEALSLFLSPSVGNGLDTSAEAHVI